jgi:carboxypeptidase family protein/Big-like domain-containing protein
VRRASLDEQEEDVRMQHVCVRAALVAIAATAAACSGSGNNPGSPTSPAPTPTPGVTVRAVTVTAAPRTSSSFQMTAKADLSDGSSRDVTNDAQWTSSNTDIATIAGGGVLTVVRSGQVEVRATYQNTTGSTSLTVTAPEPPPGTLIILSGTVSETPPASQPLDGVTVRITEGPGAGRSTVTEGGGRFGFPQFPAGQVGIEASKSGYVTWKMSMSVDHDREVQIVMFPAPPTDSSGATATARCNDGTWSWAQTRADACASNGGIAYGVCPGPMCTAQTAQ